MDNPMGTLLYHGAHRIGCRDVAHGISENG